MTHTLPAEQLRASSGRTFEIGLIIALTLTIAAFKVFPGASVHRISVDVPDSPFIARDIPVTEHITTPPPPRRPPVIIESPGDVDIENISLNTDLSSMLPPPPPMDPGDGEGWFERVESPPEPVGGYAALQALVHYPEMALRIGVQGTVFILAYIEKDGTVSRAEVLKGIGFGCDEAARSAVMRTTFVPGLQRDKPVRVKVSIPLKFKLE